MLELCQWGGFDTLAHMTYPLRYIIGKYQIPVDMKPYEEVIREILKTVADKNLALEINTAGLRREIGQTSPTLEYVKLFRELGGELLTFGSDAGSWRWTGCCNRHGKRSRLLSLCLL